MPKINSLEVVHQDTNTDSYQNLHDILVALNKSLALEKEIVDGEARASIENLLEMYVNDKEAFLRSVQTLTAQFKTSEAIYSEEILLLANQLSAQAKKTSTLSAQTANQFASVTEYAEAVASEVALKSTTYRQDEPPTENLAYGDLWFDTNDNNKVYRWNGLVWVETTDNSALESFIATEYADDIAAISAQVDAKAETWFQETDPSTAWTTQPIRDMHDKDMWYKSSTKVLKIYVASTNTWTTIEDQTAINAASAASTAQSTADGKVVTFAQSSTPVAEGEGDIWIDTSDNNRTYRWNGSYWDDLDNGGATAYARWGVQVNSNGHVAGIQLNSDSTGTSEFTVLANNFYVYNGAGSIIPAFSVSGGQVYISNNLKVSGNIVSGGTVAGVNLDAFGNLTTNSSGGYVSITNVRSNSVRASSSNTKPISDAIITTDTNVRMKIDGSLEVGKNIVAYGTITPFTGAHKGVATESKTFRQGELIVDGSLYEIGDISNTRYYSEVSTQANQKGVVGIYNEDYYEKYENNDGSITIINPLTDGNKYIIFNSVGEGKILVNGENGNLEQGDLIVSSSTAGEGMKQDDDIIRNYTVAKTREAVTFSSPSEVKLVPCIYMCG